jgi:hypothetical protein
MDLLVNKDAIKSLEKNVIENSEIFNGLLKFNDGEVLEISYRYYDFVGNDDFIVIEDYKVIGQIQPPYK